MGSGFAGDVPVGTDGREHANSWCCFLLVSRRFFQYLIGFAFCQNLKPSRTISSSKRKGPPEVGACRGISLRSRSDVLDAARERRAPQRLPRKGCSDSNAHCDERADSHDPWCGWGSLKGSVVYPRTQSAKVVEDGLWLRWDGQDRVRLRPPLNWGITD